MSGIQAERHRKAWLPSAFGLHMVLLAAGGLAGYSAVFFTPLFVPVQPRWIESAAMLAGVFLVAALTFLYRQGATDWPAAFKTLVAAFLVGAAIATVLGVPLLSTTSQPERSASLGAQLYVRAGPGSEESLVSIPALIRVEAVPGSATTITYSFGDKEAGAATPPVVWQLNHPSDASVKTACRPVRLVETKSNGLETFQPIAPKLGEHYYYCPQPGARILITLNGSSSEGVWARLNQVTRSIAMRVPVDVPAIKIRDKTFRSISSGATGPFAQGRGQPLTPQITLTSPLAYAESPWRWDQATSATAVPLDVGFAFPSSGQITTAESPVVLGAAMVNLEEARLLQAYRDLALVVLGLGGGALGFSVVYFRKDMIISDDAVTDGGDG